MDTISASMEKIAEDAINQTKMNFYKSIEIIDNEFGKDYAKNNPILLASFLQASQIETGATYIASAIQELREISISKND